MHIWVEWFLILFVGNRIGIIIEENSSTNKNSVVKFAVPVTKSTTIAITRNEENRIVSKKIIYSHSVLWIYGKGSVYVKIIFY